MRPTKQASTSAAKTIRLSSTRIREILGLFPRSAYVGYTATPFANVLIGARTDTDDDLYPRDFIFSLPRPDAYFGSERLFGREPLPADADGLEYEGLDVIRVIPDEERPALQPASRQRRGDFEPQLVDSLEDAILYFWLASAVRWARGQTDQHSSMLVHTTMYADVQAKFKPTVIWLRAKTLERLRNRDAELLERLAAIWGALRSDEALRRPRRVSTFRRRSNTSKASWMPRGSSLKTVLAAIGSATATKARSKS